MDHREGRWFLEEGGVKESVFQKEVIKSFREAGGWAEKFPDFPTSQMDSANLDTVRFTPEKPFDVMGMFRFRAFAVECKQMKGFKALNLGMMRDSQIRVLTEVTERQAAHAFVFLNVRIGRTINRLIILPWADLYNRLQVRSIAADELRSMPYFQGKFGMFNIQPWLLEKTNAKFQRRQRIIRARASG